MCFASEFTDILSTRQAEKGQRGSERHGFLTKASFPPRAGLVCFFARPSLPGGVVYEPVRPQDDDGGGARGVHHRRQRRRLRGIYAEVGKPILCMCNRNCDRKTAVFYHGERILREHPSPERVFFFGRARDQGSRPCCETEVLCERHRIPRACFFQPRAIKARAVFCCEEQAPLLLLWMRLFLFSSCGRVDRGCPNYLVLARASKVLWSVGLHHYKTLSENTKLGT